LEHDLDAMVHRRGHPPVPLYRVMLEKTDEYAMAKSVFSRRGSHLAGIPTIIFRADARYFIQFGYASDLEIEKTDGTFLDWISPWTRTSMEKILY
jgi:hypothetical protein